MACLFYHSCDTISELQDLLGNQISHLLKEMNFTTYRNRREDARGEKERRRALQNYFGLYRHV